MRDISTNFSINTRINVQSEQTIARIKMIIIGQMREILKIFQNILGTQEIAKCQGIVYWPNEL